MTNSWQKSNKMINSTDDDSELKIQTLIEECASLRKQCDELIMQKQAIEIRSDVLLAENRRIIDEKDNELKRLRESTNVISFNNTSIDHFENKQLDGNQLKNEIITLRKTIELQEQIEKENNEQIQTLQLRIKELEDWNNDYQDNESSKILQSNIDLLISRNRQLETDLQRLQLQQRNNQLAIERLDEYEETISQLQEQLDQLRSNKKKQTTNNDEDINSLLNEERKHSDKISHLLEETRLQLANEIKQFEEKILQIEINLKEKFEYEKIILQDQLQNKDKQIEIERNERENLQKFKDEQLKYQIEQQENHIKELNMREILERQLIELNEDVQSLENDKNQLNNKLDELQQQLLSRDRQIQTFQTSTVTPGSPTTITSLSDTQIFQNEQQEYHQLNSIYNQFITLLPNEFSLSDNIHISLSNRFNHLLEQFSTYIGTFSIIQEEFDSLKQIFIEKQDEIEKLRSHLELTTDKLTQIEEEQFLLNKNKSYESDDDNELEEILGLQQRAPSRQSLLSITPGEKQQLIAQNELLSSLLVDKEQELILLQQSEKTREDLIKNLQQMETNIEIKQIELNDIRNILDEKIRENSSLKKEKMYFIEKFAQFERERQEQQSIIKISSHDREKSPTLITTKIQEKNTEKIFNEEQYEKLRSDYDQLLELSERQHDESLSYYNEYTRILTLYNDLNTKHSQLQIDYDSIQSLIEQKTQAYLQCQNELNTYQNLLYHQKKKSDDSDLLRSTLNECEKHLQKLINNEKQLLIKQSELEYEKKLLEENNFKLILNQKLFEQIQLDLKRITHERDLAIVEKKQLDNEMEFNREKLLQFEEREQKLTNQIEYLLRTEKSLRNQIEQLDNLNREQIELIDQLNINGEQSQQKLITELNTLKYEYTKIEELNMNLNTQLQEQIKYSQNLQNNLEQFQQEREQDINEHLIQYQDSLREQISITARLTNENNEIRQRLDEYNQVLSSVYHLNDEIKTKDFLINKLQIEIENFQTINNTRVEKQLVKNILLSYFHTPIDKQQEVIPLLGALVGFTQEEYQKAMNAISNNYNNNTSTSWLTAWLGANPSKTKIQSETPVYHPDKSFAELLIQYVDQQSTDTLEQPILKLNTGENNIQQNSDNTSDNILLDKQLTTPVSTTLDIV